MIGFYLDDTQSGNVAIKCRCECGGLIDIGCDSRYALVALNKHREDVKINEYEGAMGAIMKRLKWRYCPLCGKRIKYPERINIEGNPRINIITIEQFVDLVRKEEIVTVRGAYLVNRFGYVLDRARYNLSWAKTKAYKDNTNIIVFMEE